MGKRTSGLTGLSRFVLQAFQESSKNNASSAQANQSHPSSAPSEAVEETVEERPKKKRKTTPNSAPCSKHSLAHNETKKYDATGLAPHYTSISQVPDHLQKYFSQRHRYFSLYSSGCLLDETGWFSVTPELVADQIAERCRCDVILDAFCGVGGNAIAFAKTCERVIALDISPTRLALARHNANIYGVADRIEFILADYISFANSFLSSSAHTKRKIDVIFLSPPWGGPEYLAGSLATKGHGTDASPILPSAGVDAEGHPEYSLSSIQPIHGGELFKLSRRITRNIAYYLPRNVKLEEVSALLESGDSEYGGKEAVEEDKEMVEVEEEWMGTKLKALTCYFGGLVAGQEDMF